jgi:hypothetical protein
MESGFAKEVISLHRAHVTNFECAERCMMGVEMIHVGFTLLRTFGQRCISCVEEFEVGRELKLRYEDQQSTRIDLISRALSSYSTPPKNRL